MLIFSNILAVALTAGGGYLVLRFGYFNRKILWRILAAGSGVLASTAFLEIFPAAWRLNPEWAGFGVLSAFLALFFFESFTMMHSCPEYMEGCEIHAIGMMALAAMSVHSFLDGFNLSIAFNSGRITGIAVGLAVGIHKFTDGLSLVSLLSQSGRTKRASLALCLVLALATPAGSFLSASWLPALSPAWTGALLGFSGGTLVYIAMADILPRIHKTDDYLCPFLFPAGFLIVAAAHLLGG